jgi:hypothetical protein
LQLIDDLSYFISPQSFICSREGKAHNCANGGPFLCGDCQSVTRWVKNPIPKQIRNKPATKIDMIALARDVQEYPDAYQAERGCE